MRRLFGAVGVRVVALGALLTAVLLSGAGAAPGRRSVAAQTLPIYTITDLGVLPGGVSSEAYGVNNLG